MKKYKEYFEFEKQTTNPYERVYSWFGFPNSKYSILTKIPKKRPFSHDDFGPFLDQLPTLATSGFDFDFILVYMQSMSFAFDFNPVNPLIRVILFKIIGYIAILPCNWTLYLYAV